MKLMPLVAWARSASYDVVGILLPGFVISLLLFTLFIPVLGYYFPLAESIGQVSPALSRLQSSFLLVVVFSYLAGFILKAIGDLVTNTHRLKRCFLSTGFSGRNPRIMRDYNEENERFYQLAADKLNRHFNDSPIETGAPWHSFYALASTLLELKQAPTKIITYQNRYELTKSLSVGFIILGIMSTMLLFITIIAPWQGALVWILCIMLFYMLALVCRNLHIKYWQYLGDELIVSTYVILSDPELSDLAENRIANEGAASE